MSLSRSEFEVLSALVRGGIATQRQLSGKSGLSLGSTNRILRACQLAGWVEGFSLTPAGIEALNPYKVDNAIVMAAGVSSRFAPLSYEKPKGLFEVRGEILIERQIRQLREAGIADITVVVGYMKESFFYLEDKFGVSIVVNPTYAERNNNGTLFQVANKLRNTYICSSDNYFSCNVFKPYQYCAGYAAVFAQGETDEYCAKTLRNGAIARVCQGGKDAWALLGYAYFDAAFSQAFTDVLMREYSLPETAPKLWEDLFAEHVRDLPPMELHRYEPGVVYEFDYLSDLCAFDRDFFANVDSCILDNICETLNCGREDITGVVPVKAGLTNLSTLFRVRGEKYIYRHPGNGTDEIVNRKAEAIALGIARDLGLDDTFVYEDPDEGWKISRYVDGCHELDYADRAQVERALRMARTLHTSGKTSPYSFDFYDEGIKIAGILKDMSYPLPHGFDAFAARLTALAGAMQADAGESVLCHNDFYAPNFLVHGDEMRLIDWEYAAMGDPACDIGNFVAQGSGYSVKQTLDILPLYYGRQATEVERRHCLAAVGVVGWYWYVWAMYKEAMGNPVGEWLYVWYRAAKVYTAAAEDLYGLNGQDGSSVIWAEGN